MISDKSILLDSNVVAGIVATGEEGNIKKRFEANLEEWRRAIKTLADKVCPTAYEKMIVSTPICYELMAWNEKWFKLVNGKEYNPLFTYAQYSITNDILKLGSKYAYESSIRTGSENKSSKIKTMDPLLAAYSIKHNCYILTENECDFPESHFDVVGIELLKLIVSKNNFKKKQRSILYLLKPKLHE